MQFNIEKILFFDIETVSQYKDLDDMPKEKSDMWFKYYDTFKNKVTDESKLPKMPTPDIQVAIPNSLDEWIHNTHKEVYRQTAAFFPEFGKVACVSMAFVAKDGTIKYESFYGDDEVKILKETRKVFDKIETLGFELCGQSVKMFDVPFLTKRCFINGLKPPKLFPSYDAKPWEVKILDTKEIWQSGNKWSLSSLDLICSSLNIESPKNGDVKGDNVTHNYWEGNHEEIKEYCEKDVKALIDIIQKLNKLD